MTSLPTGTVAFLMSDIEGSTRLIPLVGDAFSRLLDEHHDLMRAAIGKSGGAVVSTEGDSFAHAGPGDGGSGDKRLGGRRQLRRS